MPGVTPQCLRSGGEFHPRPGRRRRWAKARTGAAGSAPVTPSDAARLESGAALLDDLYAGLGAPGEAGPEP